MKVGPAILSFSLSLVPGMVVAPKPWCPTPRPAPNAIPELLGGLATAATWVPPAPLFPQRASGGGSDMFDKLVLYDFPP
jgi:hypothetical protein